MINSEKDNQIPEEYTYNQSTQQAFYLIKDITVDNKKAEYGDIVLAYNNNILVGARMWNGEYTDIPAMGHDNDTATAGYCDSGDNVTFKVYDVSKGIITSSVYASLIW